MGYRFYSDSPKQLHRTTDRDLSTVDTAKTRSGNVGPAALRFDLLRYPHEQSLYTKGHHVAITITHVTGVKPSQGC